METDCLIVAPHPDDAEIAMGGTIASLVDQGANLVIVDLTDGEPTPFGSPEIREAETKKASQLLGIKERVNLGLSNRELQDTIENRKVLANVYREYKPKILFIPYWEDAHPDHLAAEALSMAARFYAKFVKSDLSGAPYKIGKVFHYFSTHLQVKFEPNFLFDISSYMDVKIDALKAYRSQFIDNEPNQVIFEKVRTENAYWGHRSACSYAEPFVCKESIKLSSLEGLLNA